MSIAVWFLGGMGWAADAAGPVSCETLVQLLDEHDQEEASLIAYLDATGALVTPEASACLVSNEAPGWLISWATGHTLTPEEPDAAAVQEPELSCAEVEEMLAMGLPREAVVEAVSGTELAPCVGLEPPVARGDEDGDEARAAPPPAPAYEVPNRSMPQYFPSEACFEVLVDTPDPSVALMLATTVGHGSGLVYGHRPGVGAAFFASQVAMESLLVAGLLGEGPLADAENPTRALGVAALSWVVLRKVDAAASTMVAKELRTATLREQGCVGP